MGRNEEELVRPILAQTDLGEMVDGALNEHRGREHDSDEHVEHDDESGLGQGMTTEGKEGCIEPNEGEEEEGRKGFGMTTPPMVSRKEREEHELTHIPYRSWCPHCVRGRGRNQPH